MLKGAYFLLLTDKKFIVARIDGKRHISRKIDTQSEIYYKFKEIRFQRADYFLKDEKGKEVYKVCMHFDKNRNPITQYDGRHVCDHIPNPLNPLEWKLCLRVWNNANARRKRLKKALQRFTDHVYFVTLTFDDEHLATTSDSRRHHVVNPLLKTLKENGLVHYIGVKEYGAKTEREHYHFIMDFDRSIGGTIKSVKSSHGRFHDVLKGSIIEELYEGGLVDVSEVSANSNGKVSAYISKVAGYLDKDTGKTQRLIYQRGLFAEEVEEDEEVLNKPTYEVDKDGFIVVPDDVENYFDFDI